MDAELIVQKSAANSSSGPLARLPPATEVDGRASRELILRTAFLFGDQTYH